MHPAPCRNRTTCASVDVELPLLQPCAVDGDLSMADTAAAVTANGDRAVPASLSQVAADVSLPHMRWPAGSRTGYHGATSEGNWMREQRGGFAAAMLPAR